MPVLPLKVLGLDLKVLKLPSSRLPAMPPEDVVFGPFSLDLERRQLWRNETLVGLGGRALDLLSALAAAKGGVVTKDRLMAEIWPGAVVDENNIQVHISALRKALDEAGGGPRYVLTVQGQGYRLVGIKGAAGPPDSSGSI